MIWRNGRKAWARVIWKIDLGNGDMEDKLLPMQQVPPLHVTHIIQVKVRANAVWH